MEGIVDEAVARKLIITAGALPGNVYGKGGKASLLQKLRGYNNAAKRAPWLILLDLDFDGECVPSLRSVWLPDPAPMLCFRVAVREVEAWLMADALNLAKFLGVSRSRMPDDPESLQNPKESLVNIARRSRRRDIREDMAPREGSGRPIGPAYPSQLIDFILNHWQPVVAADRADSLHRALSCLRRIVVQYTTHSDTI